MTTLTIKDSKAIDIKQLEKLFKSVEWDSASDPVRLFFAFYRASHVLTCWDGEKLIGIIRSMDDDCWSANIDCLVVHKDYQGKGIGSKLLEFLLDDLKKVKYINVAPDNRKQIRFYKRAGFSLIKGCYLQKQN